MSDPITPQDPAPAAAPAEPQAGNPAAPAAPTPTAEAPAAPASPEVTPEIQKLIDDAAAGVSREKNKENKSLRDRLAKLEAEEQARKDAELSETERLQKERDEATAAAATATENARKALLRAEVAVQSNQLKIVDADAALALMDATGIQWDETTGAPTGVKEALEALTAAKPYLVAAPGTPSLDPSNPGRQPAPELTDAQKLAQPIAPGSAGGSWYGG